MKTEDFAEVSVFIRILEKRLLGSAAINRILEAPGANEALRQISQSSEYDFSSLIRVEDYEAVLKAGLEDTYKLMYDLVPKKKVVEAAAVKYDFHNLKVMLKSKYTGVDMSRIYARFTELGVSVLEAFVLRGEKSPNLPNYMSEAAEAVFEALEGTVPDPQVIDVVSDKFMYRRMIDICSELESEFITEYVRTAIDFHNIKVLLRVKNMDKGIRFLSDCLVPGGLTDSEFFLKQYDKSPEAISSALFYRYFGNIVRSGIDGYGRTGNYLALERLFDDYLIGYTKKAKYIAFGPEIPFAYLLSKENEIRQIRILVTCMMSGIREDGLRERLRENYA